MICLVGVGYHNGMICLVGVGYHNGRFSLCFARAGVAPGTVGRLC